VKTLLIDTDRYNVTRAIREGLNARRMSALAEEADRDLDLRGIGRLLAMTSNDEVNALATNRFARVFGRREVFQLGPSQPNSAVAPVPAEYLGRVIGIEALTYPQLDERTRQGWRVRRATCGAAIEQAYDHGEYIPIVRVVDGRMAFLCRNDPFPTQGEVVGMASPDLQRRLDDATAEPTGTSPEGPAVETAPPVGEREDGTVRGNVTG